MSGLRFPARARAREVSPISLRDQAASRDLVEHLIGQRFVLRTFAPRLRRIDMTQSDERFDRRREAGRNASVLSETDQDQRRHTLAPQGDVLVAVCAPVQGIVQLP
jgi:hypothetical protein